MIASLHGTLEALGNDWVIVNVGGVGFQVFVPTSTLTSLGSVGDTVHLYTHMLVRDDSISLYGFSTPEGLGLFETVTGVSGVGPKLGLALLSAMKPEELVAAVGTGDVDVLTTVPGIGKKTAGRLVLELKDKIAAGGVPVLLQSVRGNADVLAALTSLGYSVAEANRAIATLPPAETDLEEKVRLALAYFARR
jgi:Holliday junction DNA helicase RuvA